MLEITLIQDLARKNLHEVPRNILNMINLKMLYLEGNCLVELPSELFILLEKLQWLDVRNNNIKLIPKSVMDHLCLETLLLQNNQIEALPLELGFVPNLKVLSISGNPIQFPKKSIIESGLQSLTKFLRNEYILKEQRTHRELQSLTDIEKAIKKEEDAILPEKDVIMLRSFHSFDSKILRKSRSSKKLKPKKSIASCSTMKEPPKYNSNRYLHTLPVKTNEERVTQQSLKDAFLNKMKDMLTLQEKQLQKDRSKESMKRWRTASKFRRRPDITYRPEVPYDMDIDFDKIPSRRDLQKMMMKKSNDSLRSRRPSQNVNVQQLITDIVDSLKEMERVKSDETKTPRSEMDQAGREIKRLKTNSSRFNNRTNLFSIRPNCKQYRPWGK